MLYDPVWLARRRSRLNPCTSWVSLGLLLQSVEIPDMSLIGRVRDIVLVGDLVGITQPISDGRQWRSSLNVQRRESVPHCVVSKPGDLAGYC
mgnify:CR=1 FL=1